MSELSKLQKAALWSTIISCFIGVLAFLIAAFTYMGFNPFMNEANQEETVIQSENVETNKDEVVKLNDNIESNKESSIDNKLVENTHDNGIINLEKAKEMSFGNLLLIPFKKHEKAVYYKYLFTNKSIYKWIFILPILIFSLLPILTIVAIFFSIYEEGFNSSFFSNASILIPNILGLILFVYWDLAMLGVI